MSYPELNIRWIENELRTTRIGWQIISHEEVDSTNEWAKQLLNQGKPEGTVVLADSQTQGKGRMGRTWFSQKNMGIYLSLLLKPALPPDRVHQLTLVAGLAVADTLNTFSRTPATLKWPNDVLIGNKKISGILSENISAGDRSGVVIGIGINVNHARFPAPLASIATSLLLENGETTDRKQVIATLLKNFDREYQAYFEQGMMKVAERWAENSEIFGRKIQVTKGQESLEGTALRLDAQGCLVVRTEIGREISLDSGEVTFL